MNVIDLTHTISEMKIALQKLRDYNLIGVDFVLFCTGYDKLWGKAAYYEGYPVLTSEATVYLAALPL